VVSHQNDWTAYQESLKLNFILAGGQFNPLIPIENKDYARALIQSFRVDLLLSITEDAEIQAFIGKQLSPEDESCLPECTIQIAPTENFFRKVGYVK